MWLEYTFKVKRSKVKVTRPLYSAILTTMLTRQAAAVVSMGTMAMGNYCYVAVCSMARADFSAQREERGRGISWWPPTYSLLKLVDVWQLLKNIKYGIIWSTIYIQSNDLHSQCSKQQQWFHLWFTNDYSSLLLHVKSETKHNWQ